jgi:hypothetical protein
VQELIQFGFQIDELNCFKISYYFKIKEGGFANSVVIDAKQSM